MSLLPERELRRRNFQAPAPSLQHELNITGMLLEISEILKLEFHNGMKSVNLRVFVSSQVLVQ